MTDLNNNQRVWQKNDGFSLIETLVAVFILSIVSLISLNIMSSFADANQALSHQVHHLNMIEKAQEYMRDDMQNIVKRPTRNEFGGRGTAFTNNVDYDAKIAKKNLLRFTRGGSVISQADETRSSIETIEYWLIDQQLIRRSYDRPDRTSDTPFRDYILLRNVRDVTFKFFDGTLWFNEWQSDPKSLTSRLPKAIEFAWVMAEGENEKILHYSSRFVVGAF